MVYSAYAEVKRFASTANSLEIFSFHVWELCIARNKFYVDYSVVYCRSPKDVSVGKS